jgi:fatty acid desaturase
MTFEKDDGQTQEELPERATPLLAVVRIISVLGMSFGIAFGLFLALGFWWVPALISFAAAVPFFFLMRFMEKKALERP